MILESHPVNPKVGKYKRGGGWKMDEYILKMEHITKTFPGVKALDDVNFQVKRGEIHALVGENGAGKSTLMKVLSGIYTSSTYEGNIVFNGEVQEFHSIKDSEKKGIAIIYQELALCRNMNVAESIFLGAEIKTKWGSIDWNATYKACLECLKKVKLDLNPETKIVNLGVGQQQLIEICKAISKNAKLLILDEPTAALTDSESDNLLNLLEDLKEQGVTCIYISHKLDEVYRIADTITVLRDGQTVVTKAKKDLAKHDMISCMVGRELTQMYPREAHQANDVVMEVKNWTVYHPEIPDKKFLNNISFEARKGEILGIAGLMGAGRTELIMSLIGEFGANISGEIILEGEKVSIKSSEDAIKHGIGYVSEDRKRYGLVLEQDIKFNTGMSSFKDLSSHGIIDDNKLIYMTNQYVDELNIKTPSIEQKVVNLSGGNQQKVVLAKWLMTKPKLLILDEPTRGIDVGAKVEIYNIMNQLVASGVTVIMISSELPEVLGMSDRILVMREGEIVKELNWQDASQEKVMYYATGGN